MTGLGITSPATSMIFASDVEDEIFCAAASARGVAVGVAEGFVEDAVPAADVAADA